MSENASKVAKTLTPDEIKYIRQVQSHDYPLNSPLLASLEARDILWQEGHQASVVVTHFGVAVLKCLDEIKA